MKNVWVMVEGGVVIILLERDFVVERFVIVILNILGVVYNFFCCFMFYEFFLFVV